MKPWIKRTLFGLFGASILVGGLTACGHRPHGFGDTMSTEEAAEFRGKMVDRVAGKLDLNADQKQRLTVLADKLREQRMALMGQSLDPRAEMKALVAGDKFDKSRAQALIMEKTTALQSKSPEVIAALADFYDSLNPTQQQKVRDFMEHRRGHWFRRG
ncbi:Spy/CpxP family protein refolding chaperone [Rhodoferax ferrireducens]|uniref:Spy/CpxP family protein refolding chaperone n=1 Tax=Rhodoferax ferrireducens TaxID=192843 RepID=UPI000E0DD62E|nr:Spy/CpxP family protein refolding chaperone [Rhodoferax ferrireducens]